MTTTPASLERLELALLQFTLRAEEPLTLPPNAGSTLRGAFGTTFRRIACAPPCTDARTCLLAPNCAYARVFEAQPTAAGYTAVNESGLPPPFIIHPPPEQVVVNAGETFSFHLTLVGEARQYLPYFILTWRELGRVGIGGQRSRFRLERVASHCGWTDGEPRLIYSAADELVRNEMQTLTAARLWAAREPAGTRLRLEFVTPLRLKTRGEFLRDAPPFAVLVGALLRRLESLSFFYCGGSLGLDYRALLERAQAVRTAASDVRRVAWERYSQRQERKIPWGGLLGSVEYEGEWAEFGESLVWGELVGVGSNCAFGLGRYNIFSGGKQC